MIHSHIRVLKAFFCDQEKSWGRPINFSAQAQKLSQYFGEHFFRMLGIQIEVLWVKHFINDFIKQKRLCFNCLIYGHSEASKKRFSACFLRKMKHHGLVHHEQMDSSDTSNAQEKGKNFSGVHVYCANQSSKGLSAHSTCCSQRAQNYSWNLTKLYYRWGM